MNRIPLVFFAPRIQHVGLLPLVPCFSSQDVGDVGLLGAPDTNHTHRGSEQRGAEASRLQRGQDRDCMNRIECLYIHIYIYVHVNIHMYMYTYMYIYVYIHMRQTQPTHTVDRSREAKGEARTTRARSDRMHIYLYLYLCEYIYIYTCIYIYMYIYIYICARHILHTPRDGAERRKGKRVQHAPARIECIYIYIYIYM